MISVYKRELKAYFTNLSGYIPVVLILLMTGIFTKIACLNGGYPQMEFILPTVSIILIVALPILAMRSFAEEKTQKTDMLLYSLPLKTGDIVIGKFLAMSTVLALPCLLMNAVPLVLKFYGKVNLFESFGAIFAFFMLGCAMLSICMFMSSLTESQIIAAVLGVGTLLIMYFEELVANAIPTTALASFIAISVIVIAVAFLVYLFTKDYWIGFTAGVVLETALLICYITMQEKFAGLIQMVLNKADLFLGLDNFVNNELFDVSAIIYYASVCVIFCFLSMQSVDKRRWN